MYENHPVVDWVTNLGGVQSESGAESVRLWKAGVPIERYRIELADSLILGPDESGIGVRRVGEPTEYSLAAGSLSRHGGRFSLSEVNNDAR